MALAVGSCLVLTDYWPFAHRSVHGVGIPLPNSQVKGPNGPCPIPAFSTNGGLKLSARSGSIAFSLALGTQDDANWHHVLVPVNPSSTIRYLLAFRNVGSATEHDVLLAVSIPSYASLRPRSTCLYDENYPFGTLEPADSISQGGIIVGNVKSNATIYVAFAVAMPSLVHVSCGTSSLPSIGSESVSGRQVLRSTATTTFLKSC